MNDITHFKKKLEEERQTIINDLRGVGILKDSRHPDDWQAVPGDIEVLPSDSNEVADKIESYEENNDLVQKLEIQLTNVDEALAKIEKGVYGICEVGGEKIEADRLEANPSARTCKKHMNNH